MSCPDYFNFPFSIFLMSESPSSALAIFRCYFDPPLPRAARDFVLITLLSLPSVAGDLLFVLFLTPSWSFQRIFLIIVLLFKPCWNWKAQPPQPSPALMLLLCSFLIFVSVKKICFGTLTPKLPVPAFWVQTLHLTFWLDQSVRQQRES